MYVCIHTNKKTHELYHIHIIYLYISHTQTRARAQMYTYAFTYQSNCCYIHIYSPKTIAKGLTRFGNSTQLLPLYFQESKCIKLSLRYIE